MRSLTCLALVLVAGCATTTPADVPPTHLAALQSPGTLYSVQPGETLWRIARAFGLEAEAVARVNGLRDTKRLSAGRNLLIPYPLESRRFLWPVRGRSSSPDRLTVEIAAPEGTAVRAARGGMVAAATRGPDGWGQTVVLDHGDGYFSVYANLARLLVAPGTPIGQGMPVGNLGLQPLHFEVRRESRPVDALALLPRTE